MSLRFKREAGPSLMDIDLSQLPSESMLRQETMLINEVSLVLSEKRTALSVMRTGLAVLVLPLSVLSVLIVISKYYEPEKVIYLLAPLLGICGILAVFGLFLIYRSFKRIRQLDVVVGSLKRQSPNLVNLCRAMDSHEAGKSFAVDEKI